MIFPGISISNRCTFRYSATNSPAAPCISEHHPTLATPTLRTVHRAGVVERIVCFLRDGTTDKPAAGLLCDGGEHLDAVGGGGGDVVGLAGHVAYLLGVDGEVLRAVRGVEAFLGARCVITLCCAYWD